MIHRRAFLIPASGEYPQVVGNEFVEAPCGCRCCIGERMDTREAATVATPCDAEVHGTFIREFQLRLKESTAAPQNRPARDVIEEILMKLYNERVANGPAN